MYNKYINCTGKYLLQVLYCSKEQCSKYTSTRNVTNTGQAQSACTSNIITVHVYIIVGLVLKLRYPQAKAKCKNFSEICTLCVQVHIWDRILKFKLGRGFCKNCRKNFNCIIPVQILYFSFIGRGFNPLPKRATQNSISSCERLYCTQCSTVLIQGIYTKDSELYSEQYSIYTNCSGFTNLYRI